MRGSPPSRPAPKIHPTRLGFYSTPAVSGSKRYRVRAELEQGTRVVVVESGFDALPVASAQACAAVNAWAWEARLEAVAGPVLIAG